MSGYTLNGNPWAGSFILEGSTDGTSWDVMVAKSANNTFLSQEGLSTAGGNISSGYNSTVFTNQLEHIQHQMLYQCQHILVFYNKLFQNLAL